MPDRLDVRVSPDRCRSLHNHTDGEVRGCVLDLKHSGTHLSADRVRWQRANVPQVVRLSLGISTPSDEEVRDVVSQQPWAVSDVKWSA